MAKFFIERPIFAWVIAIFIMVLGGVSITQLPIAQYPPVAAPIIQISAAYPGATAQTLEDSVLAVIEREMNGATGLAYMETTSQAIQTAAFDRSGVFFCRVSTTPQRMLVPPMSTARMLSWPSKIHEGARCAQPISAASSG